MCNNSNPSSMVTIPAYSANFNANRLEDLIRMDERISIARKMLVKEAVKNYKFVISREDETSPKTVESRREETKKYFFFSSYETIFDIAGMSIDSIIDEAMELVDGPF